MMQKQAVTQRVVLRHAEQSRNIPSYKSEISVLSHMKVIAGIVTSGYF